MLIFAIDDEPRMLRLLHNAVHEAEPDAEIRDFPLGTAAISAIEGEGLKPDVIFSDIQMPGISGLELAARLRTLVPDTKIIFVTGYDQYAVDAFKLHASGYVMKPVDADRVREELSHIMPEEKEEPDKLKVQCFGRFEVFWKGEPLTFGRKQTKELFAFLIDQEGKVCTAEEISTAMWEEENNMHVTKTRIRQLISDMKKTLSEIGMESVLIRRSGQLAIRKEMVDCDYYHMLEGDMNAVNSYYGEYMTQFSWAELTGARLYFRNQQ